MEKNLQKRSPLSAAVWICPLLSTTLTLGFYGPFGLGRDFGAFLITFFLILPALAIFVVVAGSWLMLNRNFAGRSVFYSVLLTALVPLLLIPLLLRFGDPIRDPSRYALWSLLHHPYLEAARRREGVILHWDSWGVAGEENDAYLVSDPTDRLSHGGAAGPWAVEHRLGCAIVGVRRMERGVYLLTTSNCPIVTTDSAAR